MIFLQALYGIILEELLEAPLSDASKKRMGQLLSVERVHRSLRTYV